MSEYLYNPKAPRRSQDGDDEIAALENMLSPHAFREELDRERVEAARVEFDRKSSRRRTVFGVGVLVLAAAAFALYLTRGPKSSEQPSHNGAIACLSSTSAMPWSVEVTAGQPRCGGQEARDSALAPGGWISTDEQSTATVAVADIGEIEVRPGTRLVLTKSGPDRHQLELERGSIHAKVTAPPRLFVVTTPTVNAVDLGCEYDLSYIEEGATTQITVTNGAVSLETDARVVEVPAGFRARSFKNIGPTPAVSIEAPDELLFRLGAYLVDRKRADLAAAVGYTTSRDLRTLIGLLDLVEDEGCELVNGKLLQVSTQPFPWEQTGHGCHDLTALRSAWRGLYNFDSVPAKGGSPK